ncbi:hypothetical protein MOE81_07965 [Bacillus inaquosorum]|uniref:hypothetical protein n=1 Tax=Bacillus inaquosorum TaxID=483913 RepID=UPI002281C5B7|nr:hypothetical protein [Bacillus inaquosorum]MCY9057861.1 hypothetical protein [Bacillus inaquosorum]
MKNTEFKVTSFLEEYKRRDEMKRDFIIHEGYTAIEEIIKEVNQRGSLNEADIYYGTPKPQLSFSDVELGYMLTSMMEYATNHVGNPVDEECEFENKLAYFSIRTRLFKFLKCMAKVLKAGFRNQVTKQLIN